MKSLFWKDESQQLSTVEPLPKPEAGTSFTFISNLNLFLLIGGLKQEPQKKDSGPPAKKNPFAPKGVSNLPNKTNQIQQVHTYHPQQKLWKIQTCNGKLPPQRIHHLTHYSNPHLLVYGGVDKKIYSDIYLLHCETWTWKKLVVLDSHVPRLYGCMVPYITPKENKRFVMGGTGSLENVDVLDDIWALSLEKVNDTASNEIPGAFWTKVEYQNTNNQFIPVKNFTTNVISPEEVLIFGGFTSNTTATNNCYLFNMKDHRMRLVETKGIKPSARGSHKSHQFKPNILVVYGGKPEPASKSVLEDLFVYHISINTWQRIAPGGNTPQGLSSLSISGGCREDKGQLVLLGETVQQKFLQFTLEELVDQEEFRVMPNVASSLQKDFNNVSEELEEGYTLNEEQKLKIRQLESKLDKIRGSNLKMKEKIEELRTQPLPSEERFEGNKVQLTSKLLNVLLLEHKKRRFLEVKSGMLQNTIKDAEKLLVLLDGFSQPQVKAKHIRMIKSFRVDMEEVLQKENLLRKEIVKKRNLMGLDFGKLFLQSLSKEESSLLSNLP